LKKRYGQHFLSDRNILQRIVRLAEISPGDTVLEIGPGAGALTRELAAVARRVVAIEIDRDLIPALRASSPANVEIVEADALDADFAKLAGSEAFHVVGNLPYNVATPLLKRFIDSRERILDVTVMLQKEVAARIRATAGSPDYGPLSVLMQYYATPVRGFTVPPGAFTPRPKVDSAVIRLEWKREVPNAKDFTDFVHRAFGSRRKKLANNLAVIFPNRSREDTLAVMKDAAISPDARAETLTVEQFLRVYNQLR
jgi:16S rRNA (adenine1518-N6/adenine1519-N6)-dimethyltransferase